MLPTWLRALFAWEVVRDTGATIYRQNTITGARSASRITGGHQPIDRHWLETGEWSPPPKPPCGGPTERRASIFPHFEVDAPMPRRPLDRRLIRAALAQAGVALVQAGDRGTGLDEEERFRVIDKLNAALAELDRTL